MIFAQQNCSLLFSGILDVPASAASIQAQPRDGRSKPSQGDRGGNGTASERAERRDRDAREHESHVLGKPDLKLCHGHSVDIPCLAESVLGEIGYVERDAPGGDSPWTEPAQSFQR